jgi:hypothetical protein
MQLSYLNRLIERDRTGLEDFDLELECRQTGIHWLHGVKFVGPDAEAVVVDESMAYRLICHYLIDYLPERGLAEACESLREFYEYYKPEGLAQNLLSTHVEERNAEVSSQIVRRSYTAEGE